MSQSLWEVIFAKANEQLPTTGVLIEGSPMFSPIGLTPQTEYKVKIRALCGEFESNWSEEFHFNTIQQGIEDIESKFISLYPNPTSGIIKFQAQDVAVDYWRISDNQGKTIDEGNILPEEFDFREKKGIFFLLIMTHNGHQIEKIIVQ
jgi:hypothetical protein